MQGRLHFNHQPVLEPNKPLDMTVTAGSNVELEVNYNPNYHPVPSFRWYISTDNGANFIPLFIAPPYSQLEQPQEGVGNRILITGVTAAMNGYKYYCVVSNYLGDTVSRIATLTVAGTE